MSTNRKIFLDGFWLNNTGLVALWGLCPLLAVTTSVVSGLALGLATTIALVSSNFVVSVIRGVLRPEIRIATYALIIAAVVTVIQLLMQAWFLDLYLVLGIFVPLIVTNCALMGRAETFASRNSPLPSVVDGLATGLGFSFVLVLLGSVRELLGRGTLFSQGELIFGSFGDGLHVVVLPDHSGFQFALLPPGAFMCLGFLIAGRNWLDGRRSGQKLPVESVREEQHATPASP